MKRLFSVLMLFAFTLALAACGSDGSKEVVGAWKTEKPRGFTNKPRTLLIDEKTLKDDSFEIDAVFERKDGKILIRKAGVEGSSGFIVTVIDKDKIKVDRGPLMGEDIYVRTTPEDVQRIRDMPR